MRSSHRLLSLLCLAHMASAACSDGAPANPEEDVVILLDMGQTAADEGGDHADMMKRDSGSAMPDAAPDTTPDMPPVLGPVTRRPFEASDVDFIDVHMHCGGVMQDECVISPAWGASWRAS